MNIWRLVKNSLLFYWPTTAGVFLCVVLCASVLTGALLVGDSVRGTLTSLVTARLGDTELAMAPGDKFFRRHLAAELADALQLETSASISLNGTVISGDGKNRVNRVEVLGVDETFFQLGGGNVPVKGDWEEGVVLSEPLAQRLAVAVGDEIVLRVSKPSLMPREAVLGETSDLSTAYRVPIRATAGRENFGRFSLRSNQVSPMNLFVPIDWLGERINRADLANLMLVGGKEKSVIAEDVQAALKKNLRIEDLSLELRHLPEQNTLELRSSRVFIDDVIADAARSADENAKSHLTYFVNEITAANRSCPYSIVTALEKTNDQMGIIPSDMEDDQILVNEWLADDLGVAEGDELILKYYIIDTTGKLLEQETIFKVSGILAMMPPVIDSTLMPDFEGISGAANCRDWQTDIPIDLKKIREKDETYWDKYSGTPKAFITLSAGRRIWANRFGSLTAVRYQSEAEAQTIAQSIIEGVDPASAGLFFQDVRNLGEKSSAEGTNFGMLFVGLSFFLIVSAVALELIVFIFGVQRRSTQTGILKALGLSAQLIKRIFLLEAGVLSVAGAIVGALFGMLYTRLMIFGLSTVWQGAVAGSQIRFYAKPSTLIIGAACGALISFAGVLFGLHTSLRKQAIQLLSGISEANFSTAPPRTKKITALLITIVALFAAAVLLFMNRMDKIKNIAAVFFGVGTLVLIAEISTMHLLLSSITAGFKNVARTLKELGIRNTTRRPGRSLAVTAVLACGCFMIIAVGANRKGSDIDWEKRKSPTGGFALMGLSSVSVFDDLNTKDSHKSLGLDDELMCEVRIVRLRLHEGDDASCLNLNRAQRPTILGVDNSEFQNRGCFSFKELQGDKENPWSVLDKMPADNVVPAIGDYATVYWALGKNVGDKIEYLDSRGRLFYLQIVGIIKDSILQGNLIISGSEFVKHFPSDQGYRMFLVDVDETNKNKVKDALSISLRDFGVEFVHTSQKLAEFKAVENTYLSIFALIGGLGLALGAAGLGIVVLLNVLERRGELAMMRAVGFGKKEVTKMIFYEHITLMLLGLFAGVLAGSLSVWHVITDTAGLPYLLLGSIVFCIAMSALVCIWLASVFSLRGSILEGLREE